MTAAERSWLLSEQKDAHLGVRRLGADLMTLEVQERKDVLHPPPPVDPEEDAKGAEGAGEQKETGGGGEGTSER